MSKRNAQRAALGFGLFAMAALVLGSLLAGARLETSLFRGFAAALVFGLSAWVLCSVIKERGFESGGENGETKRLPRRYDANQQTKLERDING